MKMILAIMPTNISEPVANELIESDFRVTKFASTAGFLSGGNTTLMIVAEKERIAQALELIRRQFGPAPDPDQSEPRGSIYVLSVKDFARV